MKRMKTSDNDLNFFTEYEADSVKLTSYFSSSFDKKYLKAFKKAIKNKVKIIHFLAPEKTRTKEECESELLKNRELALKLKQGRKKFKKLIPSVFNKYLKLKPLDEGDYKTNKIKELELEVKDFLKKNYHVRKIVSFKELNGIIEIKNNLQSYDNEILEKINDIKAEVANLEEQLRTLETENYGEKFTYVNFLISLFKDSHFKIKVYNVEQNSEKFYALSFEFDAKRPNLNFFNSTSKGREKLLKVEDLSDFDEFRFLSPSVKKGYINKVVEKLSKYNRKLVETREDEKGFGVKLDFKAIIKDVWNDFKKLVDEKIRQSEKSREEKKKRKETKKSFPVRFIISAIGASILIYLLVMALISFVPSPILVEEYDRVKIRYTAWKENDYYPIINQTLWVNMTQINDTRADGQNNGIILGLYNNLLCKGLYYESDVMYLPACVDNDLELDLRDPESSLIIENLKLKFSELKSNKEIGGIWGPKVYAPTMSETEIKALNFIVEDAANFEEYVNMITQQDEWKSIQGKFYSQHIVRLFEYKQDNSRRMLEDDPVLGDDPAINEMINEIPQKSPISFDPGYSETIGVRRYITQDDIDDNPELYTDTDLGKVQNKLWNKAKGDENPPGDYIIGMLIGDEILDVIYGKDGYKVASLVDYVSGVFVEKTLPDNENDPNAHREIRYMDLLSKDKNGPKGISKYIADAIMDENSICPEPITVYVRNNLITEEGRFVKLNYGKDLGLRPVLAYYGDHRPQDNLPGYTKITEKFLTDNMGLEMAEKENKNTFTHSSGKQFWTMPNGMGLIVSPIDGSVKLSLGISYVYHSLTHIKEQNGRISSRSAVVTQSNWLAEMYRFMYKPEVEINKFELKPESLPIVEEIKDTIDSILFLLESAGRDTDVARVRDHLVRISRGEISPSLLIKQKTVYDKDLKYLIEELNPYVAQIIFGGEKVFVPDHIVKIFNNDMSGNPLGTQNLKKFVEYLDAKYPGSRWVSGFNQFKTDTDVRITVVGRKHTIDYSKKLEKIAVELEKVEGFTQGDLSAADFVFDTLGDYLTKTLLADGIKSDGKENFIFQDLDKDRVANLAGHNPQAKYASPEDWDSFFTGDEVYLNYGLTADKRKKDKIIYRTRNNADFLSGKKLSFKPYTYKEERIMYLENLNKLLTTKISENKDLNDKEKAYLTYLCEIAGTDFDLAKIDSKIVHEFSTDLSLEDTSEADVTLTAIATDAIMNNLLFEIQSGDQDIHHTLIRLEIDGRYVELSASKEELDYLVIPGTIKAKMDTFAVFQTTKVHEKRSEIIKKFERSTVLEFTSIFKKTPIFTAQGFVEFRVDNVADKFSEDIKKDKNKFPEFISYEIDGLDKIYLNPSNDYERRVNIDNWYKFILALQTGNPISLKMGDTVKDFVRFSNKGIIMCDLKNEDMRDIKISIAELVSSFTSQLNSRDMTIISIRPTETRRYARDLRNQITASILNLYTRDYWDVDGIYDRVKNNIDLSNENDRDYLVEWNKFMVLFKTQSWNLDTKEAFLRLIIKDFDVVQKSIGKDFTFLKPGFEIRRFSNGIMAIDSSFFKLGGRKRN